MNQKMHKVSASGLIALLIFLAFVKNITGQTSSFIHYGVEQGLSQSQVQTIVQDDEGSLWIGTLAGLTKYDGRKFETFSKRNGLAEDWITVSYKDKAGDIWFGHWAGGVSKYSRNRKKMESLNLEEYTRFKTVTSIMEDSKGYFWITTEGSGIFIYDPKANKMFSLSAKDGLASDNVYDLQADGSGNIWIATDKGITIYDVNSSVSSPSSFVSFNQQKGLPSDRVTTLTLINNNEMWIGTADTGVVVVSISQNFSPGKKALDVFHVFSSARTGGNFIEVIYVDADHTVWIGTTGAGATRIIPFKNPDRKTALSLAIFKSFNTRQGLDYFNVNSIFQDREKNIWIGTDIGLNQYRGERFQLFDQADGIPNNIIWSVFCDSKGNTWLGTNDGLSKISFFKDEKNGEEKFRVTNYTEKDGLSSNVILSIYEDKKGNMWFGTGFAGVCMLESGSGRFRVFNTTHGLAGNTVFAINGDENGNIWCGTREGASRLDVSSGTFRNYTSAEGLGGNNVYRIFRDSKGNLWFGALGGYLSVFDGFSFKKYDEKSGIAHRFILSINEDAKGNIWFGAYGGGLYKYDGKSFSNYTVKDGMITDSPYSLISDNSGNIWIGHSRGIDKFDPLKNKFFHYGKGEGFLGVETNPNAIAKDHKGNLWFGTIMGVVRFNPSEDKINPVTPKTFITGLRIFMKDGKFPDDHKFTYDQNHLTFIFNGISLTNPEKVLYQYKMEGFDKDWSPLPTGSNEAVYTNLPPGDYVFKVRACNNDGFWSEVPAQYSFFVKPPFWQTAIFYIVASVFVIFAGYGFDKLRTKNLKKAKKKLEDMVELRTVELAVKNEELAEKNKDITDSIRYAKRLQEAILPGAKNVKKYLPDSFIFYKPKDIVSGDFYYFNFIERKEGPYILMAAVDCTGHGVPGAFMSIVAHNLINQAVDDHEFSPPSEILDNLNLKMSQTMKQSVEEYKVKDGMDIAFCSMDLNEKKLQYAGAYNEIYIARGNQVLEYKADKLAIGSYFDDPYRKYHNNVIQLESGDVIYLLSDGYADQFGGPEGKKFKVNRLKALLNDIHSKPMEEQHRILEDNIESWRGKLEQVDDIMVIGVRV